MSEDYIFEKKWDGFRIMSYIEGANVRMESRGGLNYTSRYPLIADALKSLNHDCVIDGEVVVFVDGKPDFNAVQLYNGKRTPINYCVFDLLYLDGQELMHMPLGQRKQLLKSLTEQNGIFRFSESFTDGKELYQQAINDNLEGIVAKNIFSEYLPDNRGSYWLKIPTRIRQEFVIGGWAESDKTRSFRSLLFGAYNNGRFEWIGRSGGGYKHHEMPGILQNLQAIEIDKSPFVNKVLDTKGAKIHYVKPELVANFEFAAWTGSGRIRKPATFMGFREDKSPAEVVREIPEPIDIIEAADSENLEKPPRQAGKKYSPDLEAYHNKRKFDKTSEPEGGKPASEKLVFVVQKHAASHLHYDFRLELKGVLKSWAVPKGPSMKPEDHRLAIAVEDHPYDYKDFEGIIPQGQYGGGTVIVWDQGTYEPAEKIEGKHAREHWLMSHYYQDALKITLHGQKLKGDFILLKNREKNDNSWILAKAKDRYALKSDITKKDKSVVSGLTIEQMTANADAAVWNSKSSISVSNKKTKNNTVADLYQGKSKLSLTSNWTKIISEKITSEGEIELDGHTVHLTNIEKHLWKDVSKADLIKYYNSVSPLILPYLKNRPLSLHIKNIAASAGGFYIKDMEGQQPAYVDIFRDQRRVPKKGKRDIIEYAVCNNRATLTWLVNLGCIDFNPWSSRVDRPDEPDYISIDLDPSDTDFTKVISAALAVKEVIDKHKLKAVVKSSGKSGLHIFIPCMGFKNAAVKEFGKFIYEETHSLVPEITTNTVSIDHRGNKVYVDYTLNDYADTLACVYSVRPNRVPSVSTPLEWSEVNGKLEITKFTIQTIADRVEKKGDLFSMMLDLKVAKQNHQKLKKL